MVNNLYNNDCLDKLKELEDNSVDSIVTDPPYGLSFMSKQWDYDVPSQEIWEQCIRVLKPGGHLLAFAGSRTYHRMAVRIEDAGFEIRDQIMWVYGSGFPKSHDVGKNIEKIKVGGKANLIQIGTKKGLVATNHNDKAKSTNPSGFSYRTNNKGYSEVATDRTQVNGEIPVYEITNEYKGWGTALKPAHEPIVMARKPLKGNVAQNTLDWGVGGINIDACRIEEDNRFPANIIFDEESGNEEWKRYFYCPKTNKSDRSEGNNHPTVKPTDLMAYLIRLVTPKGGIVLDPFMGSGSTGKAAVIEGMGFIGIERELEYYEIAKQRIDFETNKRKYW
jgi:DNA modification methylase